MGPHHHRPSTNPVAFHLSSFKSPPFRKSWILNTCLSEDFIPKLGNTKPFFFLIFSVQTGAKNPPKRRKRIYQDINTTGLQKLAAMFLKYILLVYLIKTYMQTCRLQKFLPCILTFTCTLQLLKFSWICLISMMSEISYFIVDYLFKTHVACTH